MLEEKQFGISPSKFRENLPSCAPMQIWSSEARAAIGVEISQVRYEEAQRSLKRLAAVAPSAAEKVSGLLLVRRRR